MFREVFGFEVRYQIRQPIFAIACAIFFLLAFGAVTTDAVVIGGSIGNVNRNAPYVVMQILLVMSVLGVFLTTAFMANAVNRDFELGTHEIFFSTPLTKRAYLLGRFGGAFVATIAVFAGVVLAIVAGSFMPWLEPERIGPTTLAPYLFSLAVLVVPNVFLTGAMFFSLASITRSMLWTFAGVIAFLVAYVLASDLLTDLDNHFLAAMLDPFGFAAFGYATKYWTVAEKNTALLPLDRALVLNRLLWCGAAGAILAFTYARFRFAALPSRRRARRKSRPESTPASVVPQAPPAGGFAAPTFSARASYVQYLRQSRLEAAAILKSAPFLVIAGFGMVNILGNSGHIDGMFGTPVWPVTSVMLRVILGAFLLTLVLVLTFYAGEATWRERALRLDGVFDALPVPAWVFWGSKLTALFASVVVMLSLAAATGIGIQAWRGYYRFEPALYLQGLFLEIGVPFLLIAVLALCIQALANHKYLGFLLMVLFYVSDPILNATEWEHQLYRYASAPDAPYSDMNGYGHFVAPLAWFFAYWSFVAVVLTTLTHLFWVRGAESSLRLRLRRARERFTAGPRTAALLGAAGALATGGFIFYNTNVLNPYLPTHRVEARQAEYEKKYKRHENHPAPKITAVRADVDVFPDERRVEVRGVYAIENKTGAPIDTVHLSMNPRLRIRSIGLPGSRVEMDDPDLGYRILQLDEPLAPGARSEIAYEFSIVNEGFVNNGSMNQIARNGTFFNSFDYFPHIGYSRYNEILDPNRRRKRGLPPVVRMPKLEDESARMRNVLSKEADWLHFETTVSTSPDQIAIAPGYLQREWTENGRRYFHYAMDAPILSFWGYLSARYAVKRDRWNDVAIEIYHHPTHAYNVDRMIDGVKKSLDYFTTAFGPYQHRQVRILEFPRYARFAQALPNTIPFSESIGFIARLQDEDAIDYVFYVTAHEVAHQWWAHQVIGGDVQGATMLSESMSQYGALMVMEMEYGREKMRRFLKYELEAYLRGRGGELIEELPLYRVENQPYVHYRKGSLALYALRDHVGEDALNAALARYVRATRFQEPPYTTTPELLAFIREAVPPERQGIVEDLFETITLFENRAEEATWTKRDDGKFVVRLALDAKKFRASGDGAETAVPVDDWIDIAVFGKKADGTPPEGKVLALEKRRVADGTSTVEIVVDEEPVKAGIDPFNKLIDRSPENNLTSVKAGGG